MKLELFLKGNLAIHFYYSEDSLKKNKVTAENLYLIFPGFPQLIDKNFFKDKVNKKTVFMSVYYFGSYYSGEEFTYTNCQKTILNSIAFARAGIGIKTFDNKKIVWDIKKINIIGNSFSASPILTSQIKKEHINDVILISPLIFINKKDVEKFMSKKEMDNFYAFNNKFLNFMKRGYKNIYRGINNKSWVQLFNGNLASSKIKITNEFPKIKILHGSEDKVVNPIGSLYLKKCHGDNVSLNIAKGIGHDFISLFVKYLK